MMMFMVVVVVMLMVMIIVIIIVVIVMLFRHITFHTLYPGSRTGYFVKMEQVCVEQFIQFHITIVARDNLGMRLNSSDDIRDML